MLEQETLTLAAAQRLKDIGLEWDPKIHDFYAIPGRGLDDYIFVISNILTLVEQLQGLPVITFHGTAEWALDYLVTSEVVWLPTENQVRNALLEQLKNLPPSTESKERITFYSTADYYQCTIQVDFDQHDFRAEKAVDAYGAALEFLLMHIATARGA